MTSDETELMSKMANASSDGAELFDACILDDSTWSVEKTKEGKSVLTVTLAKSVAKMNWPMLLRG